LAELSVLLEIVQIVLCRQILEYAC